MAQTTLHYLYDPLCGWCYAVAPLVRVAYGDCRGEIPRARFARSRALLARVGGEGFPTFALERDGQFTVLDYDPYFRDLAGWQPAPQAHAGGAEILQPALLS